MRKGGGAEPGGGARGPGRFRNSGRAKACVAEGAGASVRGDAALMEEFHAFRIGVRRMGRECKAKSAVKRGLKDPSDV